MELMDKAAEYLKDEHLKSPDPDPWKVKTWDKSDYLSYKVDALVDEFIAKRNKKAMEKDMEHGILIGEDETYYLLTRLSKPVEYYLSTDENFGRLADLMGKYVAEGREKGHKILNTNIPPENIVVMEVAANIYLLKKEKQQQQAKPLPPGNARGKKR
ncbi:hypothetical protein MKQ70_32090 [Chitinophaga sedimenti]|uniref:hypothetical protein n=1 Tax=Chitinophaga sedimenti TaxID=2033606 RepID=UPI0020068251|nr:hypothetical protein [Chitinophaga sedimenti]MCK7559359.1 hypothetical protein [Chitinophaga sedimenti]